MNLTSEQIRWIVINLFLLIVSVAVHEFGHAFTADRLGDDTPRRQGRVTLNPLAHADPIGTIALPIIGGVLGGFGGFGWGKPVIHNPLNYNRKISMATGQVLVSIAGPLMNLLLALVASCVHVILMKHGVIAAGGEASTIFIAGVQLNFILMFFNLLPVPPLDGRSLLAWVLPRRYHSFYENLERYGPFIVLAFIMIAPLRQLFLVPAGFCLEHVYRLWAAIFGMPS